MSSFTIPAPTINNLLALTISWDPAGGTPAITGSATWASLGTQHDSTNNQNAATWWGVCTGTGTTVSLGVSVGAVGIAYGEFSGTATSSPLDSSDAAHTVYAGVNSFSSTALSTVTCGSQTATCTSNIATGGFMQIAAFKALSGGNELILGCFAGTDGASVVYSPGGSYATVDQVAAAASGSAFMEWLEASGVSAPVAEAFQPHRMPLGV